MSDARKNPPGGDPGNTGNNDELGAFAADPELAGMFIADAIDHLGTIEATILKLEASPTDLKLVNDIFRPFHTVKGNAGALNPTFYVKVPFDDDKWFRAVQARPDQRQLVHHALPVKAALGETGDGGRPGLLGLAEGLKGGQALGLGGSCVELDLQALLLGLLV